MFGESAWPLFMVLRGPYHESVPYNASSKPSVYDFVLKLSWFSHGSLFAFPARHGRLILHEPKLYAVGAARQFSTLPIAILFRSQTL